MARNENKVRVQIEHPNFKADCILTESKAFTYLKRIKKVLKTNISIVTTLMTPGEYAKMAFDTSGPMKQYESPEAFKLRIEKTFSV